MPTNMTADELERWATKQIAAATARGIHPLDASNAVRRFLAKLPPGADPDTYVSPAYTLTEDLTSPEVLADARADWYAKVPAKFARLLDAKEEP